jgi:hypothetical protein
VDVFKQMLATSTLQQILIMAPVIIHAMAALMLPLPIMTQLPQ